MATKRDERSGRRTATLKQLEEEKGHRLRQNRIQWIAIIIAALVGVYGVQTSRQESDQLQAAERDEKRVTCFEAYGTLFAEIYVIVVAIDESEDGVGLAALSPVLEKSVSVDARCTEARLTEADAREEFGAAVDSMVRSWTTSKEQQMAALTKFSDSLGRYMPIRLPGLRDLLEAPGP